MRIVKANTRGQALHVQEVLLLHTKETPFFVFNSKTRNIHTPFSRNIPYKNTYFFLNQGRECVKERECERGVYQKPQWFPVALILMHFSAEEGKKI